MDSIENQEIHFDHPGLIGGRKRRPSRRKSTIVAANKYDSFQTVDWLKDWAKSFRMESLYSDSQFNNLESLLTQISFQAQSWIVLTITGISVGIVASIIFIVTAFLSDLKRGICKTHWYLSKDICCQQLPREGAYCKDYVSWTQHFSGNPTPLIDFIIYVSLSVLLATSSAILVASSKRASGISGSGLAEIKTILGGFSITEFLDPIVFIVKSVALPLSIGSGLALGKEAPMVHLATCLANFYCFYFSKYRANEAKKRELYAAASAAGFACAFGAPVGGVLFVLEGLSSFFSSENMIESFFCALVACVTVQIVDPYRGKRVLYQVSYTLNWNFFEIIFFILIGVIGALLGTFFIRSQRKVQRFRDTHPVLSKSLIFQILLLSLFSSVVSFLNIYTRIDGSELLESLFRQCTPSEHLGLCSSDVRLSVIVPLFWAFLVKTGLSVISYGAPVPGGFILPALISGGLYGRIIGEIVLYFYTNYSSNHLFSECSSSQCIVPGMYSLLGSMAAFCGLTKLSVSLTVIMFELTGTLQYIVPCMITLLSTKLVAYYLENEGFLESVIRMKGFPYLNTQQEYSSSISVADRMTTFVDLVCLEKRMTLTRLKSLLERYPYQGFPIIHSKSDASLVGYIEREDLISELELYSSSDEISFVEEQSAENIYSISTRVEQAPLCIDPETTMDYVADLFKKLGPRYVIIKQSGKICGILTKKDLLDSIEESHYTLIPELERLDSADLDTLLNLHDFERIPSAIDL